MKNAPNENPHIRLLADYWDIDTKRYSFKLQIEVAGQTSRLLIDRGKLETPETIERLQSLGVPLSKSNMNHAVKSLLETPIDKYKLGRVRCGAAGKNLITRATSKSLQIICDEKPVFALNQDHGLCVLRPRRRGSATDFIEGVSKIAALSDEVLLAYLAALTAPVGQLTGPHPGCVLNFMGESSTGKSSALHVANCLMTASKEDGDLESSADTLGRLLDKIPRMPGLPFVMSDIKGNRSATLQDDLLTFAMCVSQGETRRAKGEDASSEKAAGYICVIISSEWPILGKNKCPSEGAGDFARLIHIPVAKPEQGGIFERDRENAEELAQQLETLRKRHYGKVMPEWFKELSNDVNHLKAHVRRIKKTRPDFFNNGSTRERRVLKQLAFFYTVGLYGIETDFLHLTEEQLEGAFERIATKAIGFLRGQDSADKDNKTKLTKLLLDENFVPEATIGSPSTLQTHQFGFKRKEKSGEFCYVLNQHVNDQSSITEIRHFKSELQTLCEKSRDPQNRYRTRIKQIGIGKDIGAYKICMKKVRSIAEGDRK